MPGRYISSAREKSREPAEERMEDFWFAEKADEGEQHLFAYHRSLYEGVTRYQSVRILDTVKFGKMLILDGRVQSAASDEFIYHETLVHPGLITHPDPRHVLILGGGEGASLREVLRHSSVHRVTMVEL